MQLLCLPHQSFGIAKPFAVASNVVYLHLPIVIYRLRSLYFPQASVDRGLR